MRQSKFLKVIGIIMTIFGTISIISSIFSAITVISFSANKLNPVYTSYANMYISMVLTVIVSIIATIIGIMGIINSNKPVRAKICITASIIYVVLIPICNVFNIFATNLPPVSLITSAILGYIIPTSYLVAAFQLKKMND